MRGSNSLYRALRGPVPSKRVGAGDECGFDVRLCLSSCLPPYYFLDLHILLSNLHPCRLSHLIILTVWSILASHYRSITNSGLRTSDSHLQLRRPIRPLPRRPPHNHHLFVHAKALDRAGSRACAERDSTHTDRCPQQKLTSCSRIG